MPTQPLVRTVLQRPKIEKYKRKTKIKITCKPWLQQHYKEDEEDIIGNYLFERTNIEETKKEVYRCWMLERRERGEWTQTVRKAKEHID